jgi:site-specific recombinase XerD
VDTLAERYDLSLAYMREEHLPAEAQRPLPTSNWPIENIACLERYRDWLLSGGVSEMVTNIYHIMMAGHVFGLTLKPHTQLDPDKDLNCALDYVKAKKLSPSWTAYCENSLVKFRRFLRLERGLGEETRITPFDSGRSAADLPLWLVRELDRYQHLKQCNWRDTRIESRIRAFWCVYLKLWRFFNVQQFADLKRQQILDYIDHRLSTGHSISGVNSDLRNLHSFLLFLQDEGYTVPQSLLRIPSLKQPDLLPRYLSDEQVKKLRDEIEREVSEAPLASQRRLALVGRAAFYLLWHGAMRMSEVEDLRLEDLDLQANRISVRNGKGKKDRTIYLTETAIHALEAYLAVRGAGSEDRVFLYRNAPLTRDFIRCRLKSVGERTGVKVYPHRLRHTCATQLLNAGCPVTSIQRLLGHRDLSSTLIYARAHDQTVAGDYFAAMQRVEQRLDIVPKDENIEVVKVQEPELLWQLIQRLEVPELCFEERVGIANQLREVFGKVKEHGPPSELFQEQLTAERTLNPNQNSSF